MSKERKIVSVKELFGIEGQTEIEEVDDFRREPIIDDTPKQVESQNNGIFFRKPGFMSDTQQSVGTYRKKRQAPAPPQSPTGRPQSPPRPTRVAPSPPQSPPPKSPPTPYSEPLYEEPRSPTSPPPPPAIPQGGFSSRPSVPPPAPPSQSVFSARPSVAPPPPPLNTYTNRPSGVPPPPPPNGVPPPPPPMPSSFSGSYSRQLPHDMPSSPPPPPPFGSSQRRPPSTDRNPPQSNENRRSDNHQDHLAEILQKAKQMSSNSSTQSQQGSSYVPRFKPAATSKRYLAAKTTDTPRPQEDNKPVPSPQKDSKPNGKPKALNLDMNEFMSSLNAGTKVNPLHGNIDSEDPSVVDRSSSGVDTDQESTSPTSPLNVMDTSTEKDNHWNNNDQSKERSPPPTLNTSNIDDFDDDDDGFGEDECVISFGEEEDLTQKRIIVPEYGGEDFSKYMEDDAEQEYVQYSARPERPRYNRTRYIRPRGPPPTLGPKRNIKEKITNAFRKSPNKNRYSTGTINSIRSFTFADSKMSQDDYAPRTQSDYGGVRSSGPTGTGNHRAWWNEQTLSAQTMDNNNEVMFQAKRKSVSVPEFEAVMNHKNTNGEFEDSEDFESSRKNSQFQAPVSNKAKKGTIWKSFAKAFRKEKKNSQAVQSPSAEMQGNKVVVNPLLKAEYGDVTL